MRLRRESGNFEIVLTAEVTSVQLKTNEEPEEFLGAVINNSGSLEVVTSVSDTSGVYTLTTSESSYTYTKATGVLEEADG